MKGMNIVKRTKIDHRNSIIMTIWRWEGLYGPRFGYDLAVAETDPFVEALGDDCGDGYPSAAAAEREARRMWASFRPGDELCKGVFKA